MSNLWNTSGIPHKGWKLESVYDVRDDGQSVHETDYEICMMCGNERIRYVHIVAHNEVFQEFKVGCICAEKMTNDYVNHKRLETNLRNKAARRINWVRKGWNLSKNGNIFLKKDGHHFLVFKDKKTGKYKGKIDETFGNKLFESPEEVKSDLFNGIDYFKEKGQW